MMHPSSANVITSASGSLAPTSPSEDPKLSINGAPNPSEIAARSSGVQVSLVLVTIIGAIRRRPACRSLASRARTDG